MSGLQKSMDDRGDQYCLMDTELRTNLLLDSPDREGFILLSKAAAFAEDGDLFGENDIPS